MIRIGISGYGNLAKGVECAILQNKDMELKAVFTRRDPDLVKTLTNTKVYSTEDITNFKNDIDVLINCGGSAFDLPKSTPEYAKNFNVIDSFDTHAEILNHFNEVDEIAKKNNKLSIISAGWDPGMFSLNRLYANSILPEGNDYTFWGKGVSQGHSDAIRRIEGVIDARQYTIPVEEALQKVRNLDNPELTTREKHRRECYVVAAKGADLKKIEMQIKTMPNYFADYDTIVNFIDKDEMDKMHNKLPHGGLVIRTGKTGLNKENSHKIEYSLNLDSNPEFTGSVIAAYARALFRYYNEGKTGCMTVFDIAPAYLLPQSNAELIKKFL